MSYLVLTDCGLCSLVSAWSPCGEGGAMEALVQLLHRPPARPPPARGVDLQWSQCYSYALLIITIVLHLPINDSSFIISNTFCSCLISSYLIGLQLYTITVSLLYHHQNIISMAQCFQVQDPPKIRVHIHTPLLGIGIRPSINYCKQSLRCH